MKLFKRQPTKQQEIHQYMEDLEKVIQLRGNIKMSNEEEYARYNTMIKVMQEIVIRLGGKVR